MRVSFLDTQIKIQIRALNELTNKVYALRMKFKEMHVLFKKGNNFTSCAESRV